MGSGGGGSDMPFYQQQDRLFGTQADIARGMWNQYANYAPDTLYNLAKMVDDANMGDYERRLYERMRDEAYANNASANAMERAATERQLTSMGVNPNDPRFAASLRGLDLGNAGRLSSQLNIAAHDAATRGEDMTWARTHDFYNTLAGMPTTATSSLASAGSGYANMANMQNQQDMAGSAGFGKYGQQAAEKLFADGGVIRADRPRGLRMAAGGLVPIARRPYKLNELGEYGGGSGGRSKGRAIAGSLLQYGAPIAMKGLETYLVNRFGNKGAPVAAAGSSPAQAFPVVDHQAGIESMPLPEPELYGPPAHLAGGAPVEEPTGYLSPHQDFTQEDYATAAKGLTPEWSPTLEQASEIAPEALQGVDIDDILQSVGLTLASGGPVRKRGLKGGQRLALGGMVGGGMSPMRMAGGGFGLRRQNPMAMSSASAGAVPKGGAAEAPEGAPPFGKMAASRIGNNLGQEIARPGTQAPAPVETPANHPWMSEGGAEIGKDLLAAGGEEAAANLATDAVAGAATDAVVGAGADAALAQVLPQATQALLASGAGTAAGAAGGMSAGATAGSVVPGLGTVIGAGIGALLSSFLADGGEVKAVKGLKGPRQRRKSLIEGGKVTGPGTETSDDVPIMGSDGEYMLNAETVKLIGVDALNRLNQLGLEIRREKQKKREKKMAAGGLVQGRRRR
ncbi:MAG: hypothetical protein FWH15_08235 [Betaproteobacteria bacterium]|nr:hypothetical protein [Betaproteobacteria bacterium]